MHLKLPDVDKNARNMALVVAASEGQLEVVNALLRAGTKVNGVNKDGEATALMGAAENGQQSVVQALLEARAVVNAQNKIGTTALALAARSNHLAIVNLLLEAGANANLQDTDGYAAHIHAAVKNRPEVLSRLLQAGANVNMQTKNKLSALMLAASAGCLEAVNVLLEAGADVALTDNDGTTALMLAARKGRLVILRALLQAKADVNQENKVGGTALTTAVFWKELATVKALLQAGANTNIQMKEDGKTALICAADCGHFEMVQELLNAGVDVNLSCKQGMTALVYASKSGHLEVVKALLEARADVQKQDMDGFAAHAHAAVKKHDEILQLLLRAGADLNLLTNNNSSVLMLAASVGAMGALNLLRVARVDAKFMNINGMTAAMVAARFGHHDAVRQLLLSGVDVNMQNKEGETALMLASVWDHHKVVSVLIQANADPNVQDVVGMTALMAAALRGHITSTQALIKAGANVNVQASDGKTAIICAAEERRLETVNALLAGGADVNIIDKAGNSALMVAAQISENAALAQALIKAGANVNAQAADGKTAIVGAAEKGRLNMMQTLIDSGADVNIVDKAGRTALMAAALLENAKLAQALIKAGASVNAQASGGKTAIMFAAEEGRLETLDALLQGGADVNAVDKECRTALDWANTKQTKDLLKQHNGFHGQGSSFFARVSDRLRGKPVISAVAANKQSAPTVALAAPAGAALAANSLPGVEAPAARAPAKEEVPVDDSAAQVSNADALAGTALELTEQDRAALLSLSQTSTQSLLVHGRLNEVLLTVAAHDRTLQLLVSKQKECPSLFWFYPKKRELRNWLSNPAKCLLQDTLMMVVVCPVTLCVVQCGPEGVGWEVSMPKKWVQKWGPAIMFSIYVMQAAVLAGRVVGIPLPQLPSVANLTGLSPTTMLGTAADNLLNRENLLEGLGVFAETTAAVLEQTDPDLLSLMAKIKKQGAPKTNDAEYKPLAEDKVKQMTDDAYKSMHTFLTTGDNAKLGKLEDQLRGRMERVMAPNGDVDWVSVEGRDMWLEQRKRLAVEKPPPAEQSAVPAGRSWLLGWNSKAPAAAGSKPAVSKAADPACAADSWLSVHLRGSGLTETHVDQCESILVQAEGFVSESIFASTPPDEFTAAYLIDIGITAKGVQRVLVTLHRNLHVQHHPPSPSTPLAATTVAESAATFTSEEKSSMLQLQNTIQDLTARLSKLQASTGNSSPTTAASNSGTNSGKGGGGGGGLALQQAQATANAINPRTRLPYTLDDLSEEILRLQRELAQTNRDIGNVAAVTEQRFENVESAVADVQKGYM